MSLILEKEPDHKRIQRNLISLDTERIVSIQDDEERADPLRDAIYGLMQCLRLTLQELTKIKDQPETAEENSNILIMAKEEDDSPPFL
ncbi:hypothetical protein PFISCL1PPCAC_21073, partial [Pristionchus fissidentatus]